MDLKAKAARNADVVARYRVRYGRQDLIFRLFDRLLGAVMRKHPAGPGTMLSAPPRRILLANAGHLGDVIISTALLPVLHHALPEVEIGFLTGSYSRAIVENHPLIARTHFIDHWYQSRAVAPRRRRLATYLRALPATALELGATHYDAAIDLRAWFPNLVPLLWMAGVPVRVAYDRLGFGPMLTHRVPHVYGRRHELEYQLALLRVLGVPEASLALAWPTLAPPSCEAAREARLLLPDARRYRVLHPISSTPAKDWPTQKWASLAQRLLERGIVPVITGRGARDAAVANQICFAVPGSVNAVDKLSWAGLVALTQGAEAVYAVDTSIGHVASALRRPVISVYGGTADPLRWAPFGAAVVTNDLPCHPCLDRNGCAGRECLSGITLEDVEAAARRVLHDD